MRFASEAHGVHCYFRKVYFLYALLFLYRSKKGLIAVASVLEAKLASSTGNFETKARSLGMRPTGLLPSFATPAKSISPISLVECAKFYLHILLQHDLLRKYPLLQYSLNSSFAIVFHHYKPLQFVVAHKYKIQNLLNT